MNSKSLANSFNLCWGNFEKQFQTCFNTARAVEPVAIHARSPYGGCGAPSISFPSPHRTPRRGSALQPAAKTLRRQIHATHPDACTTETKNDFVVQIPFCVVPSFPFRSVASRPSTIPRCSVPFRPVPFCPASMSMISCSHPQQIRNGDATSTTKRSLAGGLSLYPAHHSA